MDYHKLLAYNIIIRPKYFPDHLPFNDLKAVVWNHNQKEALYMLYIIIHM
jgi:hypothetical protein